MTRTKTRKLVKIIDQYQLVKTFLIEGYEEMCRTIDVVAPSVKLELKAKIAEIIRNDSFVKCERR